MDGRKLAQLRKERGLTQLELAIRTGMTPQTVASIEVGRHKNPRVETVRALADALGVTVDEFLDPIPEPEEAPAASA